MAATATRRESWRGSLVQWIVSVIALFATLFGPLRVMLGPAYLGWIWCGVAALAWWVVWRSLATTADDASPGESSE